MSKPRTTRSTPSARSARSTRLRTALHALVPALAVVALILLGHAEVQAYAAGSLTGSVVGSFAWSLNTGRNEPPATRERRPVAVNITVVCPDPAAHPRHQHVTHH
jgi:hypothetical protein